MKKYLITYDLKDSSLNTYIELHKAIKASGASWWHYLESTWIIKTTQLSANEISSKLVPHIKQGDRLLVIEIDTSNKQGWLPKDAWDWLNTSL